MTPAPRTRTFKNPLSFSLDIGVLDDLGIGRHFLVDEFCKLARRRALGLEAEYAKTLLHLRVREHLRGVILELSGELGWHILRTPKTVPRHKFELLKP